MSNRTLTESKANPRTLCLSSYGVSLDARDGHFLLTLDVEKAPLKLPPVAIRQILVEAEASLRTRAAKLALECAIPVSFFGRYGELIGHLQPPLPPRIDLRLAQYRSHAHEATRNSLSRRIVHGKLLSSLAVLGDDRSGLTARAARQAADAIRSAARQIDKAADRETLRGIEGAAARAYFQALGSASPGTYARRSRRPPGDPWNVLLSYGYAVLIRDLAGKLELAGLDVSLPGWELDADAGKGGENTCEDQRPSPRNGREGESPRRRSPARVDGLLRCAGWRCSRASRAMAQDREREGRNRASRRGSRPARQFRWGRGGRGKI